MEIDPWKSEDIESYERLIREFGIDSFEKFRRRYSDNRYARRGIVFGHRGFESIDKAITAKKPYVLLTGLMPSGKFHFGHKMVAEQIIWHQDRGAKCYVCCADLEANLMRKVDYGETRRLALEEYLINYFALGLKEKNLVFYFQSDYKLPYYRLRDLTSKRVTMNEFRAIYGDVTPEKVISVLTQVADILHPQLPEFEGQMPTVVPVGIDQDPHIRLTRDIAQRSKGEYSFFLPSSTYHKFMMGLQGGKMSSSKPDSHISLSESAEEAGKKVMSAKTGGRQTAEEQRRLGGVPEVCAVYEFYQYHLMEDDKDVEEIYRKCKNGEILCGEDKMHCAELLEKFMLTHGGRREKAKSKANKFMNKK